MINFSDKIYVAGDRGMVGSAIIRSLENKGYNNLVKANKKELDLRNFYDVKQWFINNTPDIVIIAAAKVGGIIANQTYPVEFLLDNLKIQNNLIEMSWKYKVKKLLFLGSSCIYPKLAPQPIREEHLLDSRLEKTNECYAMAKITGIKLCEALRKQYDFDAISLMPTNLYGPGDNYHEKNSHVIPALLRRFHEAKIRELPKIEIWGSGKPRREFLHVDDLSEGAIHIMNLSKKSFDKNTTSLQSHINIGYGADIKISDLAVEISRIVNYKGKIEFDISKPDGPKQKLMDSSLINNLGWKPKISLIDGLKSTYMDFLNNKNKYYSKTLNEKSN